MTAATVARLILRLASAWRAGGPVDTRYTLTTATGDVEVESDRLASALGDNSWTALAIRIDPDRLGPAITVQIRPDGSSVRWELGGADCEWFGDGLTALIADPQRLTTVAADEMLLRLGSGGPPVATVPPPVVETILAHARRNPDKAAIRYQKSTWTYRDLTEGATAVAWDLQKSGGITGARVLVEMPRSADGVMAVLGVLMAGAAYVPLDPDAPEERVRRIVAQAAPAATLKALNGARRRGTTVVKDDPGSVAYIMFTSGTTGTPKGVQVTRGALAHMCAEINHAYQITGGDRLLGFAPLHFDVSVFEIFAALTAGATLCIADDDQRLDPDLLTTMMREEGVTVAELPPALLPLIDSDDLPRLRLLSVGGEAFAGSLVAEWRTDGREFWNGYGPTETTVVVTLKRCDGTYEANPPIGRPMGGYQAFIVDKELRLLPRGAAGELAIAGPCVALGYLGQDEATARAFVAAPHGFGRMYRTGDLARWRADGDLEFLGRVDRQVKVAGHRIELTEIEAAMLSCAGVEAATAQLVETVGGPAIAGFFAGAAPDLAMHLMRLLPPYAVPTRLMRVDRIPLTASGKVDEAALQKMIRPSRSI